MEEIKLAEKLWDIANLITAFAVAQVIATTFALANHQIVSLTGRAAHWIAFVCTLIFTGCYLVAINWCNDQGARLSPQHPEIWTAVNQGRIGAILLFTLVLFLTLYGHRNNEIKAAQEAAAAHLG